MKNYTKYIIGFVGVTCVRFYPTNTPKYVWLIPFSPKPFSNKKGHKNTTVYILGFTVKLLACIQSDGC